MSKSAKKISELISKLMQDNKLTITDLRRGMVVLDNLSQDYVWNKGKKLIVEKAVKKDKAPAVLEECIS